MKKQADGEGDALMVADGQNGPGAEVPEGGQAAGAVPPGHPPPAEGRRHLSAGRLRRLLQISALVRRNPRLKMPDLLRQLGVSRSQFYRDREELARLGLNFARQGRAHSFTLTHDPLLPPVQISLSELLSLSDALAALARAGRTETAYLALRSLRQMLARLPQELSATLEPFVQEVVLAEGFGCRLQVLEVLEQAMAEGRRIVVRRGEGPLQTLDPEGIVPEDGQLRVRGLWVEENRPVSLPLAEITEAGVTPFLTPEP
jgi:predicted DNA-binding transcriptional regulator YafY